MKKLRVVLVCFFVIYVSVGMNSCHGGKSGSVTTSTKLAELNAVATSSNQVSLSWSPLTGSTSYNVYESTTSGGPYQKIGSSATTSYNAPVLVNGAIYYFVVTMVSGAGESGYSNEVRVLPKDQNIYLAGSAPSGMVIDASGNDWIADQGSDNVTELNSTGSVIGTYPVGTKPTSIAIDDSGNIWVTNWGSNNVTKLSSAGLSLGTYVV